MDIVKTVLSLLLMFLLYPFIAPASMQIVEEDPGATGIVWEYVEMEKAVMNDTTDILYLDLSEAYAWNILCNMTGEATPVWETWCDTRNQTSRHYDCRVYTTYDCTVYTKYSCDILCQKSGTHTDCGTSYTVPDCEVSGEGESASSCSCQRKYSGNAQSLSVSCPSTYLFETGPGINLWGAYYDGGSENTGGGESISCTLASGGSDCYCDPISGCGFVQSTSICYGDVSCSTGWSTTCTPGTSYIPKLPLATNAYCDPVSCTGCSEDNVCDGCSTLVDPACYSDPSCTTTTACPVPSWSYTSKSCSEDWLVNASYSISPDTSCTGVCPSGWTLAECSDCSCSAGSTTVNTGSTPCGGYDTDPNVCDYCDIDSCACSTSVYETQNTGSDKCGTYNGCACDPTTCVCYIDTYTEWNSTKCGDGKLDPCTGACTPSGSCDTNDAYECNSTSCYYKNVGTDFPDYPQLNVSTTIVYTGGVDFQSATDINMSDYLSQTNNTINMYGGTTGYRTNYTVYGWRKVRRNLTFVELTREQNPDYQSTIDYVYFRKPYNLTNNWTSTAEDIIWNGTCDFGICDVNSGTISSLSAGASQLVYTKFHADKIEEIWLPWKQATNLITYAGGYAYISADLNVTSNETIVNFTNVYYENMTTFGGWQNHGWFGYFDINANESKIIENAVVLKKYNVINLTVNETTALNPYTDVKIKWWYNTTWKNTDSQFTFSNITYKFVLPEDCSNVKVIVEGVDQTNNASMVKIDGCNVTVFNITLGPGEEIDPDVYYETNPVYKTEGPLTSRECKYWGTAGVHRCFYDCPNCYAEIGFPVPWRKTVSLENNSTSTYYNISVNASIPTSTKSEAYVKLYKDSVEYPIDYINISGGWINWTVDEIGPGEVQTYTIYLSTIEPTVTKSNETVGSDWYMYFNITGPSDLTYTDIWCYTEIETLISGEVYDNTTGLMTEVTTDDDYGPPSIEDTDGDGLFDWVEFVKPELNQINKMVISGTPGIGVICEATYKNLTNAPIKAGEYAIWNWTIVCPNFNPIIVRYAYKFPIPMGSFDIYVDGIPVEPGFRTTPPYGPYVVLSGSLDPNTNDTHYLVMKTNPVTSKIKEIFPDNFYIGDNASILLEVVFTNWASEDVTNITEEIPIKYGRDLIVVDRGRIITSEDEVFGSYSIYIPNMSAGETRTVYVSYKVPTGDAIVKERGRLTINDTQYLYYPIEIVGTSYIPLKPLYVMFSLEEPFECKDVKYVWLSDEQSYLAPTGPKEELDFSCYNDTMVKIKLKPLSVGEKEYIDVLLEEVRPSFFPPNVFRILFNALDFIVSKIIGFLNWISGLFGG